MSRRLAWCGVLPLVLFATAAAAAGPEDVVKARLSVRPARAVVEMTIASGWHVNSHAPGDAFLIPTSVTFHPPAGVRAGEVVYPAAVARRLAFGGDKQFQLYEGTVRIEAPLEGAPASPEAPVRAALRFQACDDSRCLPPRTLDLSASFRDAAPAASAGGADGDLVAGWIERWGWGLTLAWIAVLGFALNLTPCVYPLISVTVAFFGGRTAGEDGGRIGRALLYVLGICLSFSALGVAAALTGSLFGAALQRPAVLGGIALVLVGLAASNFGLYQVQMPAALVQRVGRVGDGALGAFFMGGTMGVVAAPCIAPVVVALLVFVGAQQSPALGFALFFTLGLGMGLPYVGLAVLASRIRRLPRGGAWLGWMERVFGFLLLGMAFYFVAPLLPPSVLRPLAALLLAAAGVVLGFVGALGSTPFLWVRRVAGVALVAVGLAGLLRADTSASPIAWQPFSDAALTRAVAESRPVLIDFEADWCLPCREMDRTTFRALGVVRAAESFAALKVDVTEADDAANAVMARFGVAGVPTYILLGPDGHERRRFVGYVAEEEMQRALETVLAGEAPVSRG
jgi:thiol:disulfide interchange protein DsbD